MKVSWTSADASDSLGKGKTLSLTYQVKGRAGFITTFTVYDGQGIVVLGSGLINPFSYGIRMKSFQPLAMGDILPGAKKTHPMTLNGAAGSTKTAVVKGLERECENSLLLTVLADGTRRSVVVGGLTYNEYAKYAALGKPYRLWDAAPMGGKQTNSWTSVWETLNPNFARRIKKECPIQVAALDPVGRLVDPGTTYIPDDRFYVDVVTKDPFVALESYGMAMRTATGAQPNVYNNLTVCGWFSGRNNSVKLIEEVNRAVELDMMKTIPMSFRLEPDSYCYGSGDTEQGWWNDGIWEKFHHLKPPFKNPTNSVRRHLSRMFVLDRNH